MIKMIIYRLIFYKGQSTNGWICFHHFRFFFTHQNNNKDIELPGRTIDSIFQRKLSDVICDNTKNIRLVPTAAFETLSEDNPHKNCGTEDVNQLDLQGLRGNGGRGDHRGEGNTKHNLYIFDAKIIFSYITIFYFAFNCAFSFFIICRKFSFGSSNSRRI